ncbi:hypothetical protein L3X38_024958 [Prunus dulcis]|uniref:Retrotransposon gag domain-containing protein n=1 Tax=Prunus dulcis TaxID=3755 RepID=A0AAD4Z6M8_PRUDU|nr:hypothetical protein L3X38_024958 [Prunus dulcis]
MNPPSSLAIDGHILDLASGESLAPPTGTPRMKVPILQNTLKCSLFPSTLAGATLNWFYRLEPGTVDCFDKFEANFPQSFYDTNDHLYFDDLYTIRQRDDEPLRENAARFSHEYSRCPETDDRVAFGAFKSDLRASQFHYLVHSSKWTSYGKLMKQAIIHAKAEHFNSKGVPSAFPCPATNMGQILAPAYDRFLPHQAANQAPYLACHVPIEILAR